MLLAASESAVTKKPRLRFTTRRSSSVRPFGSFHSWISRLMLISCGIQWLAQAAMYFSQAHLYLNGTSWLTSALELMTFLSSTETRRGGFSAFAGASFPDPAGTKPLTGGMPRPGIAFMLLSSSKLSIAVLLFFDVAAQRARLQQRAQARQLGVRSGGVELGLVVPRQLALRDLPLGFGG